MKIPDGKRDRVLFFATIAITSVAVVYALIEFALVPFLTVKEQTQTELDKLRTKITKAETDLGRLPGSREKYREVTAELLAISGRQVLHPVLGSFLVGVQGLIEKAADAAGVAISTVHEVGVTDIVGKRENRERAFKSYTVQVTGKASYAGLVSMIDALEQGNPLLCVSDISITSRPDNPRRHDFAFAVHWPVWKDESIIPTEQEPGTRAREAPKNE